MIIRKSQPNSVRLTESEMDKLLKGVNETAQQLNFHWEQIGLFGSRSDLNKKGGDIDLYIKIKSDSHVEFNAIKRRLSITLKQYLGDQKIDLVIDDSIVDLGAFGKLIKESMVVLWINQ